MSEFLIYGSSDKRIGDDESCFIPFCLHFVSTLGANPERRQSEGRVRPPSVIIIPKKPKNRVPLLRKKSGTKVAPDDNNNNNRDEALFTPISHSILQTAG